jgi:adenylate kinase family enzyme
MFLLGRPGSGKSHIAQLIAKIADAEGIKTEHIFDYKLLQERFLEEDRLGIPSEMRKFRVSKTKGCSGFDVVDFTVVDDVLRDIANYVRGEIERVNSGAANKLILIEFARDNYLHALKHFAPDLLREAYIFYIYADIETCIERIHRRVQTGSEYAHCVSDEIMHQYYGKDDWGSEGLHEFLITYGLEQKVKEICNKGSEEELSSKVQDILSTVILQEFSFVLH